MKLRNQGIIFCAYLMTANSAWSTDFLEFTPPKDLDCGRRVVLISGDEEYRSEESCPMLGKILSQRHGFHCTVLFGIDRKEGYVNPNDQQNIPHTDALAQADLMVIGTRFRNLPEEQLQPILDYLRAGKPVIGFRTATHAFRCGHQFGDFDWDNFGEIVIGDNWVSHHGRHKVEGGRGVVVKAHQDHPLLRGVSDVFTKSDIYGIVQVTPENATILLRGAITDSLDPRSDIVDDNRNDPMMPLAWLRDYQVKGGKAGRCFATTAGASVDFANADLRRLIVNAALYLTNQDVPASADVSPVDPFDPSPYGFYETKVFAKRSLQVSEFKLGTSARMILPNDQQE